MFGQGAGFIRLDRADKMPAEVQILQLGHFIQRLLQVIFAKIPLPGLSHRANAGSGLALADRQQRDSVNAISPGGRI